MVKTLLEIFEHILTTTQCIDNSTETFCHSAQVPTDLHPWLALDLGGSRAVRKVQIFNRAEWGDDLRDVEVRVSDTKPTTAEEVFSGGLLLGNYDGWASSGQVITIEKMLASMGRYVVVQHNSKGFIKWVDGFWEPARGRAHGYCRSESLWK